MLRWLAIFVALCVMSASADAQVFKPKSKKAAAAKKADPAKKSAKKQPRAGATKKRPKKKSKASDRGSPDDLTPEEESEDSDQDYVRIWDDDDIE